MRALVLSVLASLCVLGCDRKPTVPAGGPPPTPAATPTTAPASPTSSDGSTTASQTSEIRFTRDGAGIPVPPSGYTLHTLAPAMGLMLPEAWSVERGAFREEDRTTPLFVRTGDATVVFLASSESDRYPEPPDLISRGVDTWVREEGATVDVDGKEGYVYDRAVGPKGVGVRGRLLARGRLESHAKRVWFWAVGPEPAVLEVVAAARKGLVVD